MKRAKRAAVDDNFRAMRVASARDEIEERAT
jgi:hypothetical protein